MRIPSVSKLYQARLKAVRLPPRSQPGFADTLNAVTAAGSAQLASQSAPALSLGSVVYSLVPDVHYTLEPEAPAPSNPPDAEPPQIPEGNYSTLGSTMAAYAVQFVGNPYVWGGEDPVNGADCSGFTQTIYKTFHMTLPRTAHRQSQVGREVSLDELQPGDLLCFQNKGQTQVGHVGIYLGDGKFVHAANSKLGIIISDLSKWTDRLKTIRRLPELEPAVG